MQSTHACNSRRRERWASTGNSFTAFLLTKASEWEQGTKECDVLFEVQLGQHMHNPLPQCCESAGFSIKQHHYYY